MSNAETPAAVSPSRRVPNATRRLVFDRDGSRCTYVSPGGQRCEATAFLELDHVIPHAVGGGAGPENLRVRCRAHNRLWAEQTFGRAHVERALHFRQRRQRKYPVTKTASSSDVHSKIVVALKQMGFRDAEARRAVCAIEQRQSDERRQSLEALLREAVLEATRAA